MKIIEFIKVFWKDNKIDYLISCIAFSFIGFIVYAITESNYKVQNYLVLLPLFWLGIYILALALTFLIYWKSE